MNNQRTAYNGYVKFFDYGQLKVLGKKSEFVCSLLKSQSGLEKNTQIMVTHVEIPSGKLIDLTGSHVTGVHTKFHLQQMWLML